MNIIIIGLGKAGYLHAITYNKLISKDYTIQKVYLIDRKKTRYIDFIIQKTDKNNIFRYYNCINILLEKEKINYDKTIIDLCLPCQILDKSVVDLKQKGFHNFLVEKPFIFYHYKKHEIRKILNNIYVLKIENYLYSDVLKHLRNILNECELIPHSIFMEFSKNRRIDSYNLRGFVSPHKYPSVWEVEFPHQLYICDIICKNSNQIILKKSKHMYFYNKVLKNHGNGLLSIKNIHGGVNVLRSNLEKKKTIRIIYIKCMNNYKIYGFFYPVTEKFKKKNINHGIFLFHNNNIIKKKFFFHDDNLYNTISVHYNSFRNTKASDNYNHEIKEYISFSNLLKKIIIESDHTSKTQKTEINQLYKEKLQLEKKIKTEFFSPLLIKQ